MVRRQSLESTMRAPLLLMMYRRFSTRFGSAMLGLLCALVVWVWVRGLLWVRRLLDVARGGKEEEEEEEEEEEGGGGRGGGGTCVRSESL